MKKLALALALSMTLTGANVVAASTDTITKSLDAHIKSLDLSKTEERGALAWIKAHKVLIGSVATVVAVAGIGAGCDYFLNTNTWGVTKKMYGYAETAGTTVKGYTLDGFNKAYANGVELKDAAFEHYYVTGGVVLALALLTFDVTRSSEKSIVKGLIKSMLGGSSKEEAPAAA